MLLSYSFIYFSNRLYSKRIYTFVDEFLYQRAKNG